MKPLTLPNGCSRYGESVKVYSRTEKRWFPIIEELPDDDIYYARVWDDRINGSFAITRKSVTFESLNESLSKAYKPSMTSTKLNRRERKAQQLLAHYSRCEALGRLLGLPDPDGKRISVALWKAERLAHQAAERYCNGDMDGPVYETYVELRKLNVEDALGRLPAGFYVNGDQRGHALKIDSETPLRDALEALQWPKDQANNYILSPSVDGD